MNDRFVGMVTAGPPPMGKLQASRPGVIEEINNSLRAHLSRLNSLNERIGISMEKLAGAAASNPSSKPEVAPPYSLGTTNFLLSEFVTLLNQLENLAERVESL